MDQVALSIPSMWADHHTLAVRKALGQVSGVESVVASSLYTDVRITYDPAVTTPEALAETLAAAGYQVGATLALPDHPDRIADEAAWFQLQERITATDERDLVMSGDHRKY